MKNAKEFEKKIACFASVFVAALLMLACVSCSKQAAVVHDPVLAATICGSWEMRNKADTELYSNPGTNDESLQGTAEILYVTELSFSENRFFKMRISSELLSLSLIKNSVFDSDTVRQQAESLVEISGTYTCGKEYLILQNQNIKRDNSDNRTEDSIDNEKTTVKWSLKDDVLELVDLNTKNTVSYQRKNL